MNRLGIFAIAATIASAPSVASAFCGFYIDTKGNEMVNNATEVVLMRQGTRTVLSMQNNYQGPPQDFAMVIPVPVVLGEKDVKTLTKDVFKKVDQMGSPRLVEYWEQDPCRVDYDEDDDGVSDKRKYKKMEKMSEDSESEKEYGVKVEAKFEVGEYQIVILSAKFSAGLDRYLRDQKYQIPKAAEPLLRPYVAAGSKFFVAKVNPKKVRFENGQAILSPLRFHYDSDEFSLPIRLGLASSSGTQDLIVNILANQRFELANYKNVFVPTNFDVKDEVRTRFAEFYAALFDRTVQQNPGAVVTEYSWDAGTCDPCPGPTLDGNDFQTLGQDVMKGGGDDDERPRGKGRRWNGGSGGLVLTRLHARYGKDIPNDLIFKAAQPVAGGREHLVSAGELEHGAQAAPYNNFQARYAIRHQWTGAISCANPVRNRWGANPNGAQMAKTQGASDLAFVARGSIQIPMLIFKDIPEIDVKTGVALPPVPVTPAIAVPSSGVVQSKPQGCGCEAGGGTAAGAVFAGLVILVLRRRRR